MNYYSIVELCSSSAIALYHYHTIALSLSHYTTAILTVEHSTALARVHTAERLTLDTELAKLKGAHEEILNAREKQMSKERKELQESLAHVEAEAENLNPQIS